MMSEHSSINSESKPSPINIVVGYAWGKNEKGLIDPTKDQRWKFLKKKAESASNAVRTVASKRPGKFSLDVRIRRLRARHGDMIINAVRSRIEDADILIMDIGSDDDGCFNSNVLIELGIALGFSHHLKQSLFVLKPKSQKLPSDLAGFLTTEYATNKSQIKLLDGRGFHAALRSTIQRLAEQRLMIGPQANNAVSTEDEDAADAHQTTGDNDAAS